MATTKLFEERYYDNPSLWESWRYLRDIHELDRYHATLSLIPDRVETLLDVGTGNGAFLHIIEHERPGIRLEGIERSHAAVEMKLCSAPIILGDISTLPATDRSVEVVTALEVLEHLPFETYRIGLDQLQRVARNYILISVPYRENRAKVACSACSCIFHPNFHLRSFDQRSLTELFPDFSLSSSKLVYRPKPMFHSLMRLLAEGPFPPIPPPPKYAVCPQCGFRPRSNIDSKGIPSHKDATLIRKAKNLVRDLWPTVKEPHWFIGLYKRQSR